MPSDWNFKPYTIYSLNDALWMEIRAKNDITIPTMFEKNYKLYREERYSAKLRGKESYFLVSDGRMAVINQQQLQDHFDLVSVYPRIVSDGMNRRIKGSLIGHIDL